MIHIVDDRLREEARRFRLVFTCGECAQYDPDHDRCSLEYPHTMHQAADLDHASDVTFCKAFELR
ncbi:MAG TPA: hypothetical protein PKA58_15660 [Polyangium sp.]|jgi:hypothetical protein|nr:hypothetical protein [Polyangium sp.]